MFYQPYSVPLESFCHQKSGVVCLTVGHFLGFSVQASFTVPSQLILVSAPFKILHLPLWDIWTLTTFSAQVPSPGGTHLSGPAANYITSSFLLGGRTDALQPTECGHAGKSLVKLFMRSSWAERNPSKRGSCRVFEILSVFYNFDLDSQCTPLC